MAIVILGKEYILKGKGRNTWEAMSHLLKVIRCSAGYVFIQPNRKEAEGNNFKL